MLHALNLANETWLVSEGYNLSVVLLLFGETKNRYVFHLISLSRMRQLVHSHI